MEHACFSEESKYLVKILLGEFQGWVGKLMGIDGTIDIVKLDDTLDIKIQNIKSLEKVST
jgi:transcription elongation factor SPT5